MNNFFAYDISFLKEKDSIYWDNGQEFKSISAKIFLWGYHKDIDHKISNNLSKNLPVRYKEGIFRIKNINSAVDEENKSILEVEIEGVFSKDDVNGHSHNGWTIEEISSNDFNESRSFTNSIVNLEI